MMSHRPSPQRSALAAAIAGLLFVSLFAFTAAPVAAQTNTTATSTPTSTPTATSTPQQCEGIPQMDRTSIAVPDATITAEQGASIAANFRPDPTLPAECTIVVDLAFSFPSDGFQFGGGASWDQSSTDLVVTQFEVRPGEIRDIRAQIYTNGAQPADEVTVIADYEIWYKGDRENSSQQAIRKTIGVEATKTPPQTAAQSGQNTPANTSDNDDGVPAFISENLGMFMVFILGLVAVIGLVKRKPIVQMITGGN